MSEQHAVNSIWGRLMSMSGASTYGSGKMVSGQTISKDVALSESYAGVAPAKQNVAASAPTISSMGAAGMTAPPARSAMLPARQASSNHPSPPLREPQVTADAGGEARMPLQAWVAPSASSSMAGATASPVVEINVPNAAMRPEVAAADAQVVEVSLASPIENAPQALPPATGIDVSASHERLAANPFSSSMGELQSFQARLESLRAEKRSDIPLSEVEQWCAAIATQLAILGDNLVAKFDACASKARSRDQTIRKLHRQVQQLSELGFVANRSSQSGGHAAVNQVTPVGWPFRAMEMNGGTEDVRTTVPSARRRGNDASNSDSTPSLIGALRSGGLHGDDEKQSVGGSSPTKGRPRRAGGAGPPSDTSSRATIRRGSTDAYALERAQHAQLRREVAHLRRGHVELVGQLRARDAQVEQLTTVIRELVAQRQVSLHKRQMRLQDNSLSSLQEEELLFDGLSQFPVAGTAPVATNGDGPRAARGVRSSTGSSSNPVLTGAPNTDRRNTRTTATLGPGGVGEAGRSGTSSAASGPASSRRERSISAAPYTPRGKLRDVVGHPTRVAVETPGARSSGRTTSTARKAANIRSPGARRH